MNTPGERATIPDEQYLNDTMTSEPPQLQRLNSHRVLEYLKTLDSHQLSGREISLIRSILAEFFSDMVGESNLEETVGNYSSDFEQILMIFRSQVSVESEIDIKILYVLKGIYESQELEKDKPTIGVDNGKLLLEDRLPLLIGRRLSPSAPLIRRITSETKQQIIEATGSEVALVFNLLTESEFGTLTDVDLYLLNLIRTNQTNLLEYIFEIHIESIIQNMKQNFWDEPYIYFEKISGLLKELVQSKSKLRLSAAMIKQIQTFIDRDRLGIQVQLQCAIEQVDGNRSTIDDVLFRELISVLSFTETDWDLVKYFGGWLFDANLFTKNLPMKRKSRAEVEPSVTRTTHEPTISYENEIAPRLNRLLEKVRAGRKIILCTPEMLTLKNFGVNTPLDFDVTYSAFNPETANCYLDLVDMFEQYPLLGHQVKIASRLNSEFSGAELMYDLRPSYRPSALVDEFETKFIEMIQQNNHRYLSNNITMKDKLDEILRLIPFLKRRKFNIVEISKYYCIVKIMTEYGEVLDLHYIIAPKGTTDTPAIVDLGKEGIVTVKPVITDSENRNQYLREALFYDADTAKKLVQRKRTRNNQDDIDTI